MVIIFTLFALFILWIFNSLTHKLCLRTNMSQERQPTVFRTINISITILLISSYYEVLFLS